VAAAVVVAEEEAAPAAVVVAAALAPAAADSRRKLRPGQPRGQPPLGRLLQPPVLGQRSPVQSPPRQRLVLVLRQVLAPQRARLPLGPPPAMSRQALAHRLAR
jgi:hypothetical protein